MFRIFHGFHLDPSPEEGHMLPWSASAPLQQPSFSCLPLLFSLLTGQVSCPFGSNEDLIELLAFLETQKTGYVFLHSVLL